MTPEEQAIQEYLNTTAFNQQMPELFNATNDFGQGHAYLGMEDQPESWRRATEAQNQIEDMLKLSGLYLEDIIPGLPEEVEAPTAQPFVNYGGALYGNSPVYPYLEELMARGKSFDEALALIAQDEEFAPHIPKDETGRPDMTQLRSQAEGYITSTAEERAKNAQYEAEQKAYDEYVNGRTQLDEIFGGQENFENLFSARMMDAPQGPIGREGNGPSRRGGQVDRTGRQLPDAPQKSFEEMGMTPQRGGWADDLERLAQNPGEQISRMNLPNPANFAQSAYDRLPTWLGGEDNSAASDEITERILRATSQGPNSSDVAESRRMQGLNAPKPAVDPEEERMLRIAAQAQKNAGFDKWNRTGEVDLSLVPEAQGTRRGSSPGRAADPYGGRSAMQTNAGSVDPRLYNAALQRRIAQFSQGMEARRGVSDRDRRNAMLLQYARQMRLGGQ